MPSCEVKGCKAKPSKAIRVMREKKWYCQKHFEEIFKELSSIPDTPEKEDES
jgi:hypothetical protein